MEMRTFVRHDNGKVYAKLDPHDNQKRVYLASLFMNRMLKPGMGMAATAEYQVARLLMGKGRKKPLDEGKQLEIVRDLTWHRGMSLEQANILLRSGAITDKGAHAALSTYAMGSVGVPNAGNI